MNLAAGAIGAIAGAAGFCLLWMSWAKRERPHGLTLGAGWALGLAAVAIWTLAGGDAGAAVGVSGLTALACLILAANASSAYIVRVARPARSANGDGAPESEKLSLPLIGKRTATFLMAGPLGGAVTIALTLSLLKILQAFGVNEADRIVYALLFAPISWASLAAYVVMDDLLTRKTALLAGAGVLSILHLSLIA